eukprot:CAMPEP_0113846284 /NCGR_PEP_ID=MMETSP0372-20130328/1224_1 /TAXON_ID=340204 /ORGANISM="Lankesteria abbotti" /LENGTH=217 /DNA_ID=CAMNT_0000815415 /DNA_START=58 /DNA_END=711 /DNA_ORIENTATION=- /assembly_acc=CAM_ASM_000359
MNPAVDHVPPEGRKSPEGRSRSSSGHSRSSRKSKHSRSSRKSKHSRKSEHISDDEKYYFVRDLLKDKNWAVSPCGEMDGWFESPLLDHAIAIIEKKKLFKFGKYENFGEKTPGCDVTIRYLETSTTLDARNNRTYNDKSQQWLDPLCGHKVGFGLAEIEGTKRIEGIWKGRMFVTQATLNLGGNLRYHLYMNVEQPEEGFDAPEPEADIDGYGDTTD